MMGPTRVPLDRIKIIQNLMKPKETNAKTKPSRNSESDAELQNRLFLFVKTFLKTANKLSETTEKNMLLLGFNTAHSARCHISTLFQSLTWNFMEECVYTQHYN